MTADAVVSRLRSIRDLPALVRYLHDELEWPIGDHSFEDLTFEYSAEEAGLDPASAVKVASIKRLRPLVADQPWGVFFIDFVPGELPITVLRRILRTLVIKKRDSTGPDRQTWRMDDLLFISVLGKQGDRDLNLAHFASDQVSGRATLRVVEWDEADTHFHMLRTSRELERLSWRAPGESVDAWRERWGGAFALKPGEAADTAKKLAAEMARLAKHIRARVNEALAVESEKGPLRRLYNAFREVLIHDLDTDGFADMYAQTITYGLFTARRSRPMGITADNAADMVPATNPFLRDLLAEFTDVSGFTKSLDFDELGIDAVVQMLNAANIQAVVEDFGRAKPGEDPVIHFYEDFLTQYNKRQKVQRGIFYTPRPVVSFIVRSVHELLQTEFGLEDGLASTATWAEMLARFPELKLPDGSKPGTPFVQILDPAVGTGTFLVEVIDIVHKTMREKWRRDRHLPLEFPALWNTYVPEHLLPRLYGFELMMAPYAIAHMKIGLKLAETGYTFGASERLRVYLTNTLEPPKDFSGQFDIMAPALAHEAHAVNEVKRVVPFTVIIGNPPYSVISANSGDWIQQLLIDFRRFDGLPLGERNSQSLQDDYVKFMRLALSRLDQSGAGLVGLITPHGFLDNPTFRGMRQHMRRSLARLKFLDLHGNSNKKERTPDGSKDENVFDIQQGTAISILLKKGTESLPVTYSEVWGGRMAVKYPFLLSHTAGSLQETHLAPQGPFFLFIPRDYETYKVFASWPAITELMPVWNNGLMTSRDNFVFGFDEQQLLDRIEDFTSLPIDQACNKYGLRDVREMTIAESQRLLTHISDKKSYIKLCLYRPFDIRPLFYHSSLVRWPVSGLMTQMLMRRNLGLVTSRMTKGEDFAHVMATRYPVEKIALSSKTSNNAYLFPLIVGSISDLFDDQRKNRVNLSIKRLKDWLVRLGFEPSFSVSENGEVDELSLAVFHYFFAILHSYGYRQAYSQFLKTEFPRIPLTESRPLFQTLSGLGGQLVGFHLMEAAKLAESNVSYVGGPGPRVGKPLYEDASVWLDASKSSGFIGLSADIWNFRIGGYQVCEKWLKDRRGRTLSDEDIEHYKRIVTAIGETIRIMGEIDEVIEAHGGWPLVGSLPDEKA